MSEQGTDDTAQANSHISPLTNHDSDQPPDQPDIQEPPNEQSSTTSRDSSVQDVGTPNQAAAVSEAPYEATGPESDEQPADDTPSLQPLESCTTPNPNRRLTMRESIGTLGLLVIIGGTLACIGSLAFLIFLWTGRGSSPGAIDAPSAWRSIVLHGWVAQATTLATLLIRTAAATQATVCTAMLAALFLERHHVSKSDAAQFSVLRAVNDGPLKLVWLVLRSRPFRRAFCIETALVFLLSAGTLALQFSSTILFSDLRESQIAADMAPFPVNDYIAGEVNMLYGTNVGSQPPTNAVFGELPSNTSSDPDSKGLSVTGTKKRAFIPMREPDNRTAIHSYKGNAVALSSNIACMRPIMQSTYHGVDTVTNLPADPSYYGLINGTLHYGASLREASSATDLCDSEGCAIAEFNCSIPGGYDFLPGWRTSLCVVDAVGGSFRPDSIATGWDSVGKPWSNHSMVNLIFYTNMYTSDWNSSRTPQSLEKAPTTPVGEWNSYEIQHDRFVNVTLCFSAFQAKLVSVDMVATGDLVEPLGNWSATGVSDSSKVRKYLGVSEKNSTLADRGILTIVDIKEAERISPIAPVEDGVTDLPNRTLAEWAASDVEDGLARILTYTGLEGVTTFQACTVCDYDGTSRNPELAALIEDTIHDTGRAADGLQAYTTALANTFYNEFLKAFTGAEEVQITFTQTVQIAAACQDSGCKGLAAVISMVAIHLLCVALTMYAYVRLTHYSRQGNTWHAVSQLMGPELETILEKGNDLDDDSIRKDLKKEGNDVLVALERTESGSINIVSSAKESK
ncbi:hypothetical protein F5Y05DRAFT_299424 [Hypoxylon sp. FL0543]|nr:hypothetical protein F5Y05DRAFT_299424 [Hypoxylon sp. FL0543]